MPTADGLDMGPTLKWYEDNLDEIEDQIHQCFLCHHHRLPTRIDKLVNDYADGLCISNGLSLEDFGLHRDDLVQTFSCFNPGFWQRSTFAGLYFDWPCWFTQDFVYGDKQAITKLVPEALSLTHCVPAFTNIVPELRPDPTVDYGSFVILYQLGCDVSPDVRRVVAIECILHELTHTLITPMVYGSRQPPHILLMADGSTCSELALVDTFIAGMNQIGVSISHYSEGYKDEMDISPLTEEVCESVAALMLGFAFRSADDTFNFNPFGDRGNMLPQVENLISAYVASSPT